MYEPYYSSHAYYKAFDFTSLTTEQWHCYRLCVLPNLRQDADLSSSGSEASVLLPAESTMCIVPYYNKQPNSAF